MKLFLKINSTFRTIITNGATIIYMYTLLSKFLDPFDSFEGAALEICSMYSVVFVRRPTYFDEGSP